MALPPVDRGAVKATLISELPAVAVPMVGAPGTVNGVALLEGPDVAPGPAALVATTVQVYAVPLVRPLTTIGEFAPVLVNPPQVAE